MKYTSVIVLAALLGNASAVHMQLSKKGEGEGETAANATVAANTTQSADATVAKNSTVVSANVTEAATVNANATVSANVTEAATEAKNANTPVAPNQTTDNSLAREPEWAAPQRKEKADQAERIENESIARWKERSAENKEHNTNYTNGVDSAMKEIAASPMPDLPPYKLPLEFKDVSGILGNKKNATKPAELEKDSAKPAELEGVKTANSSANATAAVNSTKATTKPATDTAVAAIPPNTEAAPAPTKSGDAAAAAQKSTPKLAQAPGMAIPVRKIPS
jgi:hypothetical protein